MIARLAALALALIAGLGLYVAADRQLGLAPPVFASEARPIPAPSHDPADDRATATAIFAGGCFWGVEGLFSRVKGVARVETGYHGGNAASARYDLVSSGVTRHAEAVRITYDPSVVSYGTLLRVLFSVAMDPTTLNRQGPDVGAQYRSAIIPANDGQRAVAERYIAQLEAGRHWPNPIVTRIENPLTFYRAEAAQQDFMRRHPDNGYIRSHGGAKVASLQRLYPALAASGWAP
jgi:peptide-methionine (S)-S-oxide reductase